MKTKNEVQEEIIERLMPDCPRDENNMSDEEMARWLCLIERN